MIAYFEPVNGLGFVPTEYVDITDFMETKLVAMQLRAILYTVFDRVADALIPFCPIPDRGCEINKKITETEFFSYDLYLIVDTSFIDHTSWVLSLKLVSCSILHTDILTIPLSQKVCLGTINLIASTYPNSNSSPSGTQILPYLTTYGTTFCTLSLKQLIYLSLFFVGKYSFMVSHHIFISSTCRACLCFSWRERMYFCSSFVNQR